MDSDEEYASDDTVFDILSRTSLQTLDTCKAVSKRWKKIIYEPTFMPIYQERTKNMIGYFIQDIRRNKHISTYISADADQSKAGKGGADCVHVDEDTRILASSNQGTHVDEDTRILASSNQGIMCCEKRKGRNYRYYICKPATNQWLALPNPKLRHRTVAVAVVVFKANPLHYKIFRLSEVKIVEWSMMEYLYEVFDSKTWMWRATQGVKLPYDEIIHSHRPVVSVGECVYLQTHEDNVLAFDFAQECFRKFSLPESIYKNDTYKWKRLVEYEGGLGFTCVSSKGNLELWIWRRNHGWTSKVVINNECANLDLVGFYNGGVAVMKTNFEVVFYKLEDCSFTKVDYPDLLHGREIFQFRSDLESVDLRGCS